MRATAAARATTSTASAHRTLRRVVAGEQIRRGRHAEERTCRSSAAASAAVPSRLRRPLRRRRGSRTSRAGARSHGRPHDAEVGLKGRPLPPPPQRSGHALREDRRVTA